MNKYIFSLALTASLSMGCSASPEVEERPIVCTTVEGNDENLLLLPGQLPEIRGLDLASLYGKKMAEAICAESVNVHQEVTVGPFDNLRSGSELQGEIVAVRPEVPENIGLQRVIVAFKN